MDLLGDAMTMTRFVVEDLLRCTVAKLSISAAPAVWS